MSVIGPSLLVAYSGMARPRTAPPPLEKIPVVDVVSLNPPQLPKADFYVLAPEDNPLPRKLIEANLKKAARAKGVTLHIDFVKTLSQAQKAVHHMAEQGRKYNAILSDNQMQDDEGHLKSDVGIAIQEWLDKPDNQKYRPMTRSMYSADPVKGKMISRLWNFFGKTQFKLASEKTVADMIQDKQKYGDAAGFILPEPERRSLDGSTTPLLPQGSFCLSDRSGSGKVSRASSIFAHPRPLLMRAESGGSFILID